MLCNFNLSRNRFKDSDSEKLSSNWYLNYNFRHPQPEENHGGSMFLESNMWGIASSGNSKLFFPLSMKRIKCGIVKETGSIFNTPAYCISRFCLCGSHLFFQAGDCVLKMFPHTQDICLPLVCLANHQNVWTSWVDTCNKFIQQWTRDKLSSEGIWGRGGGDRTENCFFLPERSSRWHYSIIFTTEITTLRRIHSFPRESVKVLF